MPTPRRLPNLWPHRACADTPLELWYGPADDTEPEHQRRWRHTQAQEICATCSIQTWCLDDELRRPSHEQYGFRGGMTASARQKLINQRNSTHTRRAS